MAARPRVGLSTFPAIKWAVFDLICVTCKDLRHSPWRLRRWARLRIIGARVELSSATSPSKRTDVIEPCQLLIPTPLSHLYDMRYRFASANDSDLIAPMNLQLIQDEGHHNAMDIPQLAARMSGWLNGEYQAVLFEEKDIPVGYALFRFEPEFVYLRQLFVAAEHRRRGVARDALRWLWDHAWADAPRLRIEVLAGNVSGREFWQSVGFTEYCVTMESAPPSPNE